MRACLSLQARWTSEGLQSDSLSLENGAIMSNAARWSLIVDPQLQGRQWIVSKEAANDLCILQQSQPKYIDRVRLYAVVVAKNIFLYNLLSLTCRSLAFQLLHLSTKGQEDKEEALTQATPLLANQEEIRLESSKDWS